MPEVIRFYTDEHVSRAVVRGLRERGADVVTVPEAGLLRAGDLEHVERARREGLMLIRQALTAEEMEGHVEFV